MTATHVAALPVPVRPYVGPPRLRAAGPPTTERPVATTRTTPEHTPAAGNDELAGPEGTEAARTEAGAPSDQPGCWQLVYSAQRGESDAFAELYDRYVGVVFRYVLFRLGDRELAEDVTSETFLRALRRITSISYQGRDVGAWFVTIARNLVLDQVKSSRFRLEIATAEVTDGGDTDDGPEQQLISGVTRSELLNGIARLGDDQRECVTLRFLQGLSVAETAQVMERNDGAIKALQHRAVRRLAQLLPDTTR